MSGDGLPRLRPGLLGRLPAHVRQPAYDRARIAPGIVHLGLGAFHRAHQAVYVDDALAGDPGWGIVGASLRSPATRDALAPQGDLYTVVTQGPEGERFRVISSVLATLVAPDDPGALVARLADPATRIVSLTVTEKGYCRDARGGLDAEAPAVLADLACPERPASMPGLVVAGLGLRRARGLPPFTVLACDNLRANGAATRAVLLGFAERVDPGLARWMEAGLECPSTMVDRIVPKTTPADVARLAAACGFHDAWPVVAEPFGQWVIEDRFPLGRPDWASPDITFAADVAPWEEMKLRLLNGAHSALAYAGLLAGHATVAEAFGDPALRRYLERLGDELAATLEAPAGLDPAAYRATLHARFANPAIRHSLSQIAADGSQKLPQRLMPAARALARQGRTPYAIAAALAAWIGCWRRAAAGDAGLRPDDPLGDALLLAAEGPADAATRSVLGLRQVFEEGDAALLGDAVAAALAAIEERGIRPGLDASG